MTLALAIKFYHMVFTASRFSPSTANHGDKGSNEWPHMEPSPRRGGSKHNLLYHNHDQKYYLTALLRCLGYNFYDRMILGNV